MINKRLFRVTLQLVALAFLIFLNFSAECEVVISEPLMWDVSKLEKLKTDSSYLSLYRRIIKTSDSYCKLKPIVVTEKDKTFAPDNHYFCSLSTYWWPDSSNTEKYIIRDGIPNPECNLYDKNRLLLLLNRCQYLSVAFYLTHDKIYYESFVKQIRAWFVDKDTYMYPTFEYAQVIPGFNNNKGTSTGFIGAYPFNSVIESIRLVNSIKRIDKETIEAIKNWILSFARWADFGIFSEKLHNGNNNIGLAYDVTLVNMYLFCGKTRRARRIAKSFAKHRLLNQISFDGSQPEELKRTQAFTYSLFNLTHIIDFCYLMRCLDSNYYFKHSMVINRAFDYLSRYIGRKEEFPYQQITDWDTCEKDFFHLLERKNRLLGEGNYAILEKAPPLRLDYLLK